MVESHVMAFAMQPHGSMAAWTSNELEPMCFSNDSESTNLRGGELNTAKRALFTSIVTYPRADTQEGKGLKVSASRSPPGMLFSWLRLELVFSHHHFGLKTGGSQGIRTVFSCSWRNTAVAILYLSKTSNKMRCELVINFISPEMFSKELCGRAAGPSWALCTVIKCTGLVDLAGRFAFKSLNLLFCFPYLLLQALAC